MASKFKRETLATAAKGEVDTLAESIDSVVRIADTIGDLPSTDPYRRPLATAVHDASQRQEDVRAWHWRLRDKVERELGVVERAQDAFRTAAQAAARAGSQQKDDVTVAREVEDQQAAVGRAAVAKVTTDEKNKTEAMTLAQKCVEALTALQSEIDKAKTDHLLPNMRSAPALEQILQLSRVERDLSARPPAEVLTIFQGYVQRGETDKADMVIASLQPRIRELKRMTPRRLAEEFTPGAALPVRDGAGDQMAASLWELEAAFQTYRQDTMPQSILLATTALESSKQIFDQLCGYHGKFAKTLDPKTVRQILAPGYHVDPDAVGRYAFGRGGDAPPGWTSLAKVRGVAPYRVRGRRLIMASHRNTESRIASIASKHVAKEHMGAALGALADHVRTHNVEDMPEDELDAHFKKHAKDNPEHARPHPKHDGKDNFGRFQTPSGATVITSTKQKKGQSR